jgi:hypothetical protein
MESVVLSFFYYLNADGKLGEILLVPEDVFGFTDELQSPDGF